MGCVAPSYMKNELCPIQNARPSTTAMAFLEMGPQLCPTASKRYTPTPPTNRMDHSSNSLQISVSLRALRPDRRAPLPGSEKPPAWLVSAAVHDPSDV